MLLNLNLSLYFLVQKEKRESKALHKEFKWKIFYCKLNGWMNELLTLCWWNEILGQFSLSKQLLAWDSFKDHLTYDAKRSLKFSKTLTVIFPSGWAKCIQAWDFVWYKPFNWLAARSNNRGFTVKCAKPRSWLCDITSKNFEYVLNGISFS